MKRRDFLYKTAGLAGVMMADLSMAQVAPCPPALRDASSTNCGPSDAPSWFQSMPERTWMTPVTNTLSDVTPSPAPAGSPSGILTAWTGGCVDQNRGELILAANGGHTDYAGNEVYACQLKRENPSWIRLSNPSSDVDSNDVGNSSAMYPDGKPRAVHGWSHCMWAKGKVWYLAMTGMWRNGRQSTAVWSFDRNSLGDGPFPVAAADSPWTYHGLGVTELVSSGSNVDWQSSSTAYDSDAGRLWSHCAYSVNNPSYPFFSVDANTGAITRYPDATDKFAQGNFLTDAMSVIVNGVWIILAPDTGKIWLLDLANPTSGMVSKTSSGSPAGFTPGAGAVYHAASRSILVYDHKYGSTIRKLTVPTNPFTGNFVWSSVSAASGSMVPGGQSGDFRGVYSKFNMVQDMGNGQSALAVVLNIGGPVYVYKLPVSGV